MTTTISPNIWIESQRTDADCADCMNRFKRSPEHDFIDRYGRKQTTYHCECCTGEEALLCVSDIDLNYGDGWSDVDGILTIHIGEWEGDSAECALSSVPDGIVVEHCGQGV